MITITCDLCDSGTEFHDEETATRAGWTVAEDEPGATCLHGLCPDCGDDANDVTEENS